MFFLSLLHRFQSYWQNLVRDLEYQKDKWYMLWDVISLPGAVLLRGWGDCDDFARLSHAYFGTEFKYEGNPFKFLGLYALVYRKKPHHMVAVWQGENGLISVGDRYRVRFHNNMRSFKADFGRNTSGHSLRFVSVFDIVSDKVCYRKTFKVK